MVVVVALLLQRLVVVVAGIHLCIDDGGEDWNCSIVGVDDLLVTIISSTGKERREREREDSSIR